MNVVLGIDTSNYTTSMCLLGQDGKIKADERIILEVASGSRGLRQSEALFQHVQNIPQITEKLAVALKGNKLVSIGVSEKPRPQEQSYLPVFLPGLSLAEALGHMLGVPCHRITHQETHIWGGIGSAGGPHGREFLAIHLSGGTTELTLVKRDDHSHRLEIQLLGETLDLHAGQLVDRLGVKMGLPFPSGPSLEQLAIRTTESVPVPTFHRDGMVSFSGPLTALERLVGQASPESCARACFLSIARTLVKWIRWSEDEYPGLELLIVGGVASNQIIRQVLREQLPQWRLYFAKPIYSVDNAYGAALYSAFVSGCMSQIGKEVDPFDATDFGQ